LAHALATGSAGSHLEGSNFLEACRETVRSVFKPEPAEVGAAFFLGLAELIGLSLG
jgi:hypothetical protein